METKAAIYIPGETGEISDGYHTFNELYEHRHALFITLLKHYPVRSWRSKMHADKTEIPGWFIAGLTLPTGSEITYHLPNRLWAYLNDIVELPCAPQWDGHTSQDVIKRLLE